jgi:hypothetical protein
MSKVYVLDANAVLALLLNTPGAARLEQVLREANRLNTPLLVSVVSWGEIFYLSWQGHGQRARPRNYGSPFPPSHRNCSD